MRKLFTTRLSAFALWFLDDTFEHLSNASKSFCMNGIIVMLAIGMTGTF